MYQKNGLVHERCFELLSAQRAYRALIANLNRFFFISSACISCHLWNALIPHNLCVYLPVNCAQANKTSRTTWISVNYYQHILCPVRLADKKSADIILEKSEFTWNYREENADVICVHPLSVNKVDVNCQPHDQLNHDAIISLQSI